MSKSTIAILLADETIESISCYTDGKYQNNGLNLFENFQDLSKVKELISLGNLHYLKKNISAPENTFHDFENRHEEVCLFYGRDRGDTDYKCKKFNSLQDFINSKKVKSLISTVDDVCYIFNEIDEQWYTLNSYSQEIERLSGVLLENAYIEQHIKDYITSIHLLEQMHNKLTDKPIKNKKKL